MTRPSTNHKRELDLSRVVDSTSLGAYLQDSRDQSLPLKTADDINLLVLTAKSERSLLDMIDRLQDWIRGRKIDRKCLRKLSFTLCLRRSLMQWGCSFTISSPNDTLFVLSRSPVRITRSSHNARNAFIFTGQGAQWIGMGRQLMLRKSKFLESLQRSDTILQSLGSKWSLIEELLRDKSASKIDESAVAQPAVTSLQIALVDLLDILGITPAVVLGHSSGEIAAAYAAGKLTHASALKISYNRGFISAMLKTKSGIKGAMIAVGLGEADVLGILPKITPAKGMLSVACVNSPNSTTVSGDHAAVVELKSMLELSNIFCRVLKVDIAYHSMHMRSIAEEYLQRLEGIKATSNETLVQFVSSVTGGVKTAGFGPDYWVENLVSKVRFSDALECLSQAMNLQSKADSTSAFIEIGPRNALSGAVQQTLVSLGVASPKRLYIPTLIRNRDSIACIFDTVGRSFEIGCPTKLEPLLSLSYSGEPVFPLHDLPSYAWDHTGRYWQESRSSKEHRFRPFPYHDLLGLKIVDSSPIEPSWRNMLSEDCLPWLRDHVVDNFTIFPGSGYLCMAIEALRQTLGARNDNGHASKYVLRDVHFLKALVIPESPGKVEIQLILRQPRDIGDRSFTGWQDFRILSVLPDGAWTEHCHGSIGAELLAAFDGVQMQSEESALLDGGNFFSWLSTKAGSETVEPQSFYAECETVGNVYGPSFATLQDIRIRGHETIGVVKTPNIADLCLLDFCSHI